jgi:hypothetical protein
MSSNSSKDDSERLEQIVAYLDGELSAEESAQVEQQLSRDESYRQELQSMERIWATLDDLPPATVGDQFSKTTMELVVEDARREIEQRTLALPVLRRRRRFTSAMMFATCALLGFLVFRIVWHNPNRSLIADLPVIKYVDLYTQFEDPTFLKALHEELGDPPWAPETDSLSLQSQQKQFQLVSSLDTRRNWLEQQSPEEKVSLRAKFNRFQELSEAEQQHLRDLHAQVLELGDERLIATLLHYHQWLRSITPTVQYELRQEKTPLERARYVAAQVELQRRSSVMELSEKQLGQYFRAILRAVGKSRSQTDQLTEQQRNALQSMRPDQALRWFGQTEHSEEYLKLKEELATILPEGTLEELWKLPEQERREQMWSWFRQAWMLQRPKAMKGEVSQEELEKFFVNELRAEDQERLLALPREEMLSQLRRMYERGLSDGGMWQEFRRRGPGPPRDGGPRHGRGGPGPRLRQREGWGEGRPPLGPPPRGEGDRPPPGRPPFDERPGRPGP